MPCAEMLRFSARYVEEFYSMLWLSLVSEISINIYSSSQMAMERSKAIINSSASERTKPSANQPKHMPHVEPEPSDDDLVDFRGLAILPRCYGSLLERACISHPDLAICPKRSLRWREFAYETLGELLFFLTSTRRREMIHKAREHLQTLWEEAQGLGFDLSWLTPIVNSCLALDSSSSDVENISGNVEAWKKHKNTLHCQLTTLTMQIIQVDKGLAALEVALKRAKEEQERFLFTGL